MTAREKWEQQVYEAVRDQTGITLLPREVKEVTGSLLCDLAPLAAVLREEPAALKALAEAMGGITARVGEDETEIVVVEGRMLAERGALLYVIPAPEAGK